MGNILYQNLFGLLLGILLLSGIVSAAGPASVNLGSSGNFVILSKSGISTTGTTSITGDIGVSPIDSTAITGFGLMMDSSNQFSTSSLVNGKIYAANYAPPTPATMTTAVSDMQTAYTDAAGRTNPTATELGAGNIGGMTLAPGLYKWGTGVTITGGVTLSGSSNDVWIFQIGQNLDVGNGAIITLSGGAQAQNVFWQVAGQATLGTTSDTKGIILSQTAVIVKTGAHLNGRALAQTAVTLDANAVTAPTSASVPTPTPTTTSTPTTTTTGTTTSPEPSTTTTPTGSTSSTGTTAYGPTLTQITTPAEVSATPGSGYSPTGVPSQSVDIAAQPQSSAQAPAAPSTAPTTLPEPTPTTQPTPAAQPTPQPTSEQMGTGNEPPSGYSPTGVPSQAVTPPEQGASSESIPGANLPTLAVVAVIALLGAGLYYYQFVMKK